MACRRANGEMRGAAAGSCLQWPAAMSALARLCCAQEPPYMSSSCARSRSPSLAGGGVGWWGGCGWARANNLACYTWQACGHQSGRAAASRPSWPPTAWHSPGWRVVLPWRSARSVRLTNQRDAQADAVESSVCALRPEIRCRAVAGRRQPSAPGRGDTAAADGSSAALKRATADRRPRQ